MLTRRRGYLSVIDDVDAPPESSQLQDQGWALLRGVFSADEVAELRAEIETVYADLPADERRPDQSIELRDQFRYEMLNRSAACQRALAHPRTLAVVEPLLGEDCHVIANTAWWNPGGVEHLHGGGKWHIDAGPHIPRPADVAWDDRIPYPIFAVATHILLQDCPTDCGPTGVIPGSHKSGQAPPRDRLDDPELTWNDVAPLWLDARAGDVQVFVSDVWHRRMPTGPNDAGRLFLQVHYGRRDLAQRIRPTADANHLSPEAAARAQAGTARDRTLVGLHNPYFYDG